MKFLAPTALALGAAAVLTTASPEPSTVTIAFDKDVYLPGETAHLTVSGEPGTIVWLGFDFDPGPTDIPGIGLVDLGFSNSFHFAQLPVIPEAGTMEFSWQCNSPCENPISLNDLYVQGIALDPNTLSLCPTNSDVLNVEDLYGYCESQGCTPGYWKNHEETWAPTGLNPSDSWNETFDVVGYDPDVSLLEALNPPTELQTFGAHSVAALLNALHPDSGYGLSADAVKTLVKDAVESGSWPEMLEVKDILAGLNESGCVF